MYVYTSIYVKVEQPPTSWKRNTYKAALASAEKR